MKGWSMNIAFFVFIMAFVFPFSAIAQESQEEKPSETKVGALLGKQGAVITKTFIPVESPHGCLSGQISFEALKITVAGSQTPSLGMKVSIKDTSSRIERERGVLLDMDELDGLITAVDYMLAKSAEMKGKPSPYTEVKYATRDAFNMGFI
jgi:hypothetical protein